MPFLSKADLKKHLNNLGIKVEGNYVRKSDITKCLADIEIEYKGFDIDKSDDDYENYLIYDIKEGKYLGEILDEGQPVAHTIGEAKKMIEWYIKHRDFKNF